MSHARGIQGLDGAAVGVDEVLVDLPPLAEVGAAWFRVRVRLKGLG